MGQLEHGTPKPRRIIERSAAQNSQDMIPFRMMLHQSIHFPPERSVEVGNAFSEESILLVHLSNSIIIVTIAPLCMWVKDISPPSL